MAFVNIEDLVGTVECLVFPRVYEQYRALFEEDSKIFIEGRVSAEDDKPSKLIAERAWRFDEMPRVLWIQFGSREEYLRMQGELLDLIGESDGIDEVRVYLRDTKQYRKMEGKISITPESVRAFGSYFGGDNVRVTAKKA